MTQVILGKSRVREICMPGSVRAKAEWLSYSTIPRSKCATELPILLALLASVKLSYRTSFEIAD